MKVILDDGRPKNTKNLWKVYNCLERTGKKQKIMQDLEQVPKLDHMPKNSF